MSVSNIDPLLARAEREAVATALRAHPEWTLAQVASQFDGRRGEVLAQLTIEDLLAADGPAPLIEPADDGPPINRHRLRRAEQARGEDFERIVLQVLEEAGRPVGAAYLRARVGGPRWKLQEACRRLVARGRVNRRGMTSSTEYWLA